MGDTQDTEHPRSKYKSKVPAASHAVPGTPNKWLICSKNELFFFSDGVLCLGRTSLSAEPGAVAVGVGELEGGFRGGRGPPQLLQAASKADITKKAWGRSGPSSDPGGPWTRGMVALQTDLTVPTSLQSGPNACQPWPHVTPASLRPWFSSLRISSRGQLPDGLPGLPRTRTTYPWVPPLGSFPPPPVQHWHPEPTCSFSQSVWEGHP